MRAFSLSDMTRYGWTDSLSINPIGEGDLRGIPAIHRAARIRAEAIATLDLCCYAGEDSERVEKPNVPQAKLFDAARYNEYQTRFVFWETVGESLAYRNKAFIWKNLDPLSGRVIEWFALHPDQVACKADGFEVEVRAGYVDPVGRGPARYEVDDSTILFVRGHGQGGTYEPPTAVQVFRQAMMGPVGRQSHEARMWRRGTAIQQAILFPQGVSSQQADEWREGYRSNYVGADGDTTLILGGGADIKPIGMTAADAQFVELARLTVHDASRIMGVPANLLGAQEERPVPNLEQDLAMWLRFGLGPELGRIEAALEGDLQLFPPGSQTYPRFETDNFIRGDVAAEADVLVKLVQAGIITPNEARGIRGGGLDDLPYGDIAQVTPVGGAPNPNGAPMQPMMNGGAGQSPN